MLIDTKLNNNEEFVFSISAEFTLREWIDENTGSYKWSLPSKDSILCFEQIGETFDDGRYRQISFKAITVECKYELTRYLVTSTGETDPNVSKIMKFSVRPDRVPDYGDNLVFNIDATPMAHVTVEVGKTFLVETVQSDNGFLWEEPVHNFACVKVINKNFGEFTTGYRIWMLEANREKCNEVVTLARPEWWSGEEKTGDLHINVIATACETPCAIGQTRASDTSCQCVTVQTEETFGNLLQLHEFAVGSVNRIWMKSTDDNMNQVTLRQFSIGG